MLSLVVGDTTNRKRCFGLTLFDRKEPLVVFLCHGRTKVDFRTLENFLVLIFFESFQQPSGRRPGCHRSTRAKDFLDSLFHMRVEG